MEILRSNLQHSTPVHTPPSSFDEANSSHFSLYTDAQSNLSVSTIRGFSPGDKVRKDLDFLPKPTSICSVRHLRIDRDEVLDDPKAPKDLATQTFTASLPHLLDIPGIEPVVAKETEIQFSGPATSTPTKAPLPEASTSGTKVKANWTKLRNSVLKPTQDQITEEICNLPHDAFNGVLPRIFIGPHLTMSTGLQPNSNDGDTSAEVEQLKRTNTLWKRGLKKGKEKKGKEKATDTNWEGQSFIVGQDIWQVYLRAVESNQLDSATTGISLPSQNVKARSSRLSFL